MQLVTRPDLSDVTEFHGIVTASPKMRALFERIRRVARSDATVLLRGPSGSGKELVARAIHASSPRSSRAMRAVNAASFTGDLLASELFGHLRGAFTGAVSDRPGLFSQADGGTVFLDEVAEIPMDVQGRLLRVLQERSFTPLGGTSPVEVDVRIISATNKSLRALVEEGRFREDLMYRIRVVLLFLPALTERPGDIDALAWHFVDQFNRQPGYRQVHAFTAEAIDALRSYAFPGNIRELRNNIEQAFVLGEGDVIELDDLAPEVKVGEPPKAPASAAAPVTLADQERERILTALSRTRGKKGDAARLLGMSRSTLWRKMREYGI